MSDLVDTALQIHEQGTHNVTVEYPNKDHVTNIYKQYLLTMKSSYGIIGIFSAAVTLLVTLAAYIFDRKDNPDNEINMLKSFIKYLKNLFT